MADGTFRLQLFKEPGEEKGAKMMETKQKFCTYGGRNRSAEVALSDLQ